jgi:hypothetical protein
MSDSANAIDGSTASKVVNNKYLPKFIILSFGIPGSGVQGSEVNSPVLR